MEIFLPIAHMDVNIALIASYGALVGFLSGLVGVGGGFLITPLLIFTGVPPIVAVSSGAAQIAGTASGASYLQWRHGNIDFKMALLLAIGSWAGGACGVLAARLLVREGHFGNVVMFLYVVLLGIIGAGMLIESLRAVVRRAAPAAAAARSATAPGSPPRTERLRWQTDFPVSGVRLPAAAPLALGGAAGILTSLMGVGGGFIMVPTMLYLLRMPTRIVVGTSTFQLLFTTAAVSVMQAGINHSVDPLLAGILILGSVFGTRLGAWLGARLPGEKLRLILALVVVAVAVKMTLALVIAPSEPYEMSIEVH
ncbi:MAG: sulfite exporter TauE/SafE family protein [Betaproteobacteria bacterium]|nr:sulfite exporter TauE/SafE family protein [Betaproteobacteria bacterium]